MLTIVFSMVHDKNQIKAQNAGLIQFFKEFICMYSHISAHKKGQNINHIGQTNIQIIIHIIHPIFPRLNHQNFLVQRIGR